jgi:long-chain acyl-CoA synthetase
MLAELVATGTDLRGSALRLCVCGGAPLSVELQERWADATGVELRQGYGLTEAGPVCLFNRIDTPNARGTLGVPFPGVDVAIMSAIADDGAANQGARDVLPDGEAGEICVRGANVFRGYVGAATNGLARRGEWLATGDEGVRSADGSVSFLRVLKPMFTRNGFNIYPRELERAVRELAGVRDAEVSAMPPLPRKDRGIPASLEHDIRLRVWGTTTADEVKRWCEARLSAYKQPTTIEIVEG